MLKILLLPQDDDINDTLKWTELNESERSPSGLNEWPWLLLYGRIFFDLFSSVYITIHATFQRLTLPLNSGQIKG